MSEHPSAEQSPFSELLGRDLVAFVDENFFGVLAASTDNPDKIAAMYPDVDYEIAKCIASLSNWYVHERSFQYTCLDRQWTFFCMEQVMMAHKVIFFDLPRAEALTILGLIESAPEDWRRLSEAGKLSGLYRRCWPGLVKHIGRFSILASDPDHQASLAAEFTRVNKLHLQTAIQRLKYVEEPRFRFVIDTVRLHNRQNPSRPIHLVEATAGDIHYSLNADFFHQLLPALSQASRSLPRCPPSVLCDEAMSILLLRHASLSPGQKTALDVKSFEHGVSRIGDDCLGAALRELLS